MSNQQPTIYGEPATPSWPNNATFWRNQRVTVTGGAGFLGSFVVEKLRERGAAPPAPNSGGERLQRTTEWQRSL